MPILPGSLIVQEVFSSVQGEGPLVGVRQIFLRLFGCHLNCAYCDTPETKTVLHPKGFMPASFLLESPPGSGTHSRHDNPILARELVALLKALDAEHGPHHSVAVTGGEPLLQAAELVPVLEGIRDMGLGVYLETAGDLVRQLEAIGSLVDWIAMDIKLPSATRDIDLFARHDAFLKVASSRAGVKTFAKCVVASSTPLAEIERSAKLTSAWGVTLVIQPATAVEGGPETPSPEQVLEWACVASKHNPDTRAIPQVHKLMRLR
jgi:7-carboxy-7-deazaguanine synthase